MQNKLSGLKTALLISGSGTTMHAILEAIHAGRLTGIYPGLVISSNHDAGGVKKAREYDVPVAVVERKKFTSPMAFGEAILEKLRNHEIELVSQNGWLPLTPINVVKGYEGMIINQHPGPLDVGRSDFGGKGMYGERVTAARLAYLWLTGSKEWWTEATVHAVSEQFDKGAVIEKSTFQIGIHPNGRITKQEISETEGILKLKEMTAHVQGELLPLEHSTVIRALQQYGSGKTLHIIDRATPLIEPEHEELLHFAKQLADNIYNT